MIILSAMTGIVRLFGKETNRPGKTNPIEEEMKTFTSEKRLDA
jgi:hypothetical protein